MYFNEAVDTYTNIGNVLCFPFGFLDVVDITPIYSVNYSSKNPKM